MEAEILSMENILVNFAEQIKEGYALGQKIKVTNSASSIVIAGMGGSALPGELLRSYLIDLKIPIFVVKDYQLPNHVNSNTLVFSISYSGNTVEVLETFKLAYRKGCHTVVLASGGKLIDLAKDKDSEYVELPPGLPPRMAYGYMFSAILRILENSGIIESQQKNIEKVYSLLKNAQAFKDKASDFILPLLEKTPLIYTSSSLSAIGYKWKINFNETAKRHAFCNVFPEMNHNELMGFLDENKNYFVFFIKDESDDKAISERISLTKQLLKKNKIDSAEINLTGTSRLSKILSAVYIGDWLAYLLALKQGTDPEAVVLIEDLKKKMRQSS